MRERNHELSRRMRTGQTIVAEREKVESESERMSARRRARKKRTTMIIVGASMLGILGVLAYLGVRQLVDEETVAPDSTARLAEIQAVVVDEDNRGQISTRVQKYIVDLEQAFAEQGYKVSRVTLPTGMSRALYIDLEGQEMYFKVSIDRGATVTAEDAARILNYLATRELKPAYVDIRVEGKAYYK